MFKKTLVSVLLALLAIPAVASAASGAIVFSEVWERQHLGPDREPVSAPPGGGLFAFEHGDVIRLTHNPADEGPSFSANGHTIAFVREGDIWVMRTDGSGQRQLTSGRATDSRPIVSPNGRYVLFERRLPRQGDHDLYTCDLRGGVAQPLTATPADEHEATFSPDGRRVIYVLMSKGKGDIWSIRPSGTERRRLTHTPRLNDFAPHCLGRMIVFGRGPNWVGSYAAIYAMNSRGKGVRKLVVGGDSVVLKDVSAATHTILYQRARGLWVKRLNGQARKIVSFSKDESTAGVFSPDGRRIAALHWDIYGQSLSVLNAANGHRTKTVTSGLNVEGGESNSIIGPFVAWQPVPRR